MFKPYSVQSPWWVSSVFHRLLWRIPTTEKCLYLTFDDGPIPDVTPWVLNQLALYDAKATFFCIGKNAKRNPAIYQQILDEGHRIGNHTFNHLNGWKTDFATYWKDIRVCSKYVDSNLFRPPYGKVPLHKIPFLRNKYKIVMWDVLSRDFDVNLSPEQCLQNVINYAVKGSIIVFHDSIKAWPRLQWVLPRVLEHYANQGFIFKILD